MFVFPAYDRRLEHLRMLDEDRFNLVRRNPSATDLEHIVASPAVRVVAVCVPAKRIPGVVPAVDDCLCGPFGIVPVAPS